MMARMFPLAGLLRLRQMQEEQAASDLAVANAKARVIAARQAHTRDSLGATAISPAHSSTLYAVAAARASSRSMLAELGAIESQHREVIDRASEVFAEARARSIGLEKLADRHQQKQTEDELKAEQAAIDEMASTGWHRKNDGGTE